MEALPPELAAAPRSAPGLALRAAAGEVLVHDPATGRIHILNRTGARVLRACDGTRTLAAIVDDLVSETGAERSGVASDVLAVCDSFRSQGLIS